MVVDGSSVANFDEVIVEHIHLDWNVDFENKLIAGKVTLNVLAVQDALKIVSKN
jgi:hypothetical protein